MALEVESVVDGSVHAQKALRRSGRFEALQLALASSHHLMRVLRPIVHSESLFVRAGQPQSPERQGIRAHEQFLVVVAELEMPIDLARLPVEIGFILTHAATAHEFTRELQVRKADRHRATTEYLIKGVDRTPGANETGPNIAAIVDMMIGRKAFWASLINRCARGVKCKRRSVSSEKIRSASA